MKGKRHRLRIQGGAERRRPRLRTSLINDFRWILRWSISFDWSHATPFQSHYAVAVAPREWRPPAAYMRLLPLVISPVLLKALKSARGRDFTVASSVFTTSAAVRVRVVRLPGFRASSTSWIEIQIFLLEVCMKIDIRRL